MMDVANIGNIGMNAPPGWPRTADISNGDGFAERCLFRLRCAVNEAIRRWEFSREGKLRLHYLSGKEVGVMRRFVQASRGVVELDILDGATHSLYEKGFLHPALPKGDYDMGSLELGCPYRIRPWVLRYLRKHPVCLE
jgi:hypothetical protein